MLKFISTTGTQTGLVVTAYLDRKKYPTGLKPDPQLISSPRLRRSKTLPQWNYTIEPNLSSYSCFGPKWTKRTINAQKFGRPTAQPETPSPRHPLPPLILSPNHSS